MQPAHSKNDLGSPRQKGSSPTPNRNAGLGVLQSMLRAQVGNPQTLIISKSREQMLQTVQPRFAELTLRDGKPIHLQPLHKCLRLAAINLFHGLLLLGANPAHGCGKQFSTDLLQNLLGGYKYAELDDIKQAAVSCAGNPELIDKSADAFLIRLFREETIRVDTGGSENAHDLIMPG